MDTYTCYNSLRFDILNKGDIVIFNNIRYEVEPSFLNRPITYDNNIIFEKLKIDNKYDFCSNIYGYETNSGEFPYARDGDYLSLTKLTLEIFLLLEEEESINFLSQFCKNGNM